MVQIGGGDPFLGADFASFTNDLFRAIQCPEPTPTPTPEPTPTPTPTPEPTPTGEVLSETGAPVLTHPPSGASVRLRIAAADLSALPVLTYRRARRVPSAGVRIRRDGHSGR